MKKTNRREFLLDSGVFLGTALVFFGATLPAMAKSSGGVSFSIKKGKKGCSKCEAAMKGILKDPEKKKRLDALFPDTKKVTVYTRIWSSKTKVPKDSIAMGRCCKSIKSKAKVYVPGCTKQMKASYVLEEIEKALG
jgi:hypothetical protein